MKKYIIKITLCIGMCAFLLITNRCTKNFEEFNTNPYGADDDQLAQDWNKIGANFFTMQRGIMHWTHWKFQLQQNLNGDVYAQYLIPPTPFGGNVNNVTYGFNEGWNLWPWKLAFEDVMLPALNVKKTIDENNLEESTGHFNAWAKILKVYAMHRVSDIYGPVVYSKFGFVDVDIPYDTQKDAYYQFFEDLKSAVEILTPYADDKNPNFKDFDLTYDGNIEKWIKAANSLRLRLAIRIAQVEPDKAQTEFEAAISHKYGVMASNNDNFVVDLPDVNPLQTISNSWLDTRMSATMESYLKGYTDSRMSKYFAPIKRAEEYSGIRQGIAINAKTEYQDTTSAVGSWFETNNKIVIMTYSEVCFLKAEATLRGWSAGSEPIKDLYENGVKASFSQWGASGADTYLADNASVPAEYIDPLDSTENDVLSASGLLSTATIAWDVAATQEQKLEKIITQKWIALFPDGQEAWSEFRRTGYPYLFPLVVNASGGAMPDGQFVKRIKFSSDEYATNKSEVDKAILLIGGLDGYNVRLWWDVSGDAPADNF